MDTVYTKKTDEIGSEFWDSFSVSDKKFFLTGRTALEYIIRDILNEKEIKSVLLPSYCCRTMIKPFLKHGLKVRFYDVFFDKSTGLSVSLPPSQKNEIFYLIRYFGYSTIVGFDYEKIRKDYCTIIEDTTHSWLNEAVIDTDYRFTSYKKWTGISGIALAEKKRGSFFVDRLQRNKEFVRLRNEAFSLKRKYIETGDGDKTVFLRLFEDAENLIEDDYCNYEPDYNALGQLLSLNIEAMKSIRRSNAEFLIRELGSIDELQLMFHSLSPRDVPLFVPVLFSKQRDEIRRFLINREIYLPIHWPISDYHLGLSERAQDMYKNELSIVCDQRYGLNDMKRIVDTIKEFYCN